MMRTCEAKRVSSSSLWLIWIEGVVDGIARGDMYNDSFAQIPYDCHENFREDVSNLFESKA